MGQCDCTEMTMALSPDLRMTRATFIAYIKIEYPDYDFNKPYDDKDNRRISDEISIRIFPSSRRLRISSGIKKRTASIGAHEFVEAMIRGSFPRDIPGWKDLPLNAKGNDGNHRIRKFVLRYRRRHEKIPTNETLRAALKLHLAAKTKFSNGYLNVQIETFIKGGETHLAFKSAIDEITKKISGKREGRENYLRAILANGSRIGNTPMPFSRTHLQTYTARRHAALVRHIRPDLPKQFCDARRLYKQSL